MTDAMNAPTTKAELLAFMQDQWDGFVRASDGLPDEVWLGPVDVAGWTIRDHVGHVVRWLQAEIPFLETGTPIPENAGMPEALWQTGDTDAINAWFRTSLADMTPEQIRAERDRLFPILLEVVSEISEGDLTKPARERGLELSDRPLLTVMSENYGYHFDDHRNQIEQLARSGGVRP